MYASVLEKEKVSVKLLYLFEPSLVNQYKMINEAEDETAAENFTKSFIKKVLSTVGKFMVKFTFIAVIAFLLILITVEYDIFMLIAKALGMAVIGTYIGDKISSGVTKATDYLIGQYNIDEARMNKLLLSNNFEKINFDDEDYLFGSCVQIKNEKGEKINEKMSVKDAIVMLTKSKDKKTAEEANSIYENIMLSAKGKIKRKFSSYNWFGLKNILTYLQKKAETIQGYLSSLVKLIISIFSSKNLNESKKIIKKQLKKMIFFNEKYLSNKNTQNFYNENYIYPNTKRKIKNIIATFITNDGEEFKINTINKTITADKNLLKKIFNDDNIESDTYTWNKNEYKAIKSFIENNVSNGEVNQKGGTRSTTQTVSGKEEQIENKKEQTGATASKTETKNLEELDKINPSKPSVFGLKIINSMINSSISKYLIIGLIVVIAIIGTATTMGGSAAAEKAKIAAEASAQAAGLSADAIAEAGQKAAETAMEQAKGGSFLFLIQRGIKWLGWPASLGAGLTYAALSGYIKKLTAGEISQSIKKAETSTDAKETLTGGIDKVENIIKKEDKKENKKEGFLSKTIKKVKNIFGSKKETKKETTDNNKQSTIKTQNEKQKKKYLNNIEVEEIKDQEKYNIALSLLDEYEDKYLTSVQDNFLQKYDLQDKLFNQKIKDIGAIIISNNRDFRYLISDYEMKIWQDLSRRIEEGVFDKVVKILQNNYGNDLKKYLSGEYIDNSITNDSYQYIRNKPEILYNESYIMEEYFKIENKFSNKKSYS